MPLIKGAKPGSPGFKQNIETEIKLGGKKPKQAVAIAFAESRKSKEEEEIVECVYIEWVDSSAQSGWILKEDIQSKLMPIKSIGFLLAENEDSLTVTTSVAEHCVDSPITIPKVSIVHREIINLNKE